MEDYQKYGTAVTINLKVVQPVTMTLADATAAVTAWVETVKTADPAPEWLTKKDAAEATMKAAVTDEAKKAIVADNAAEFVIAYAPRSAGDSTEDFTFEAAGTTKAGKVRGTLEIKLGADSTEKSTVPFEFIIPMQEEEEKPPVETTPEVTKVEILKDGATVETETVTAGGNITFTAKVTGNKLTAGTDDKVVWTVDGSADNKSTIADGVLSVGADETATTLTVKATSETDSTKSASVTVTVTPAES